MNSGLIMKRLLRIAAGTISWLFSLLYIDIAVRTWLEMLFPDPRIRCGTPMMATIFLFLCPLSYLMLYIVYRDWKRLHNPEMPSVLLKALFSIRAVLGALTGLWFGLIIWLEFLGRLIYKNLS